MNGECHRLVASVALACLDAQEREILCPRWRGIETGATLTDDSRTFWDVAEVSDSRRHLIHRCYVDSDDPKDHGCIAQALSYSTGCAGFAKSFVEGEIEDYTEIEFLENLGMFFGVVSHHVADLCTPVHVGHKMNYRRAGAKSARSFHSRFERQMGILARSAKIRLHSPHETALEEKTFWDIARTTYNDLFVPLEELYVTNDRDGILEVTSTALDSAIQHTANLWHTILMRSQMLKREWSIIPLV